MTRLQLDYLFRAAVLQRLPTRALDAGWAALASATGAASATASCLHVPQTVRRFGDLAMEVRARTCACVIGSMSGCHSVGLKFDCI
jgi:hypothetical protein